MQTNSIVAVDPGLRHCGWGRIIDGELAQIGLTKNPEVKERGPLAWRAMAYAMYRDIYESALEAPTLLVIEKPQVYKHAGGDPDDLLQLVGVAGGIAAVFDCLHMFAVTPREWKGTVPKDVHNARVVKTHPELLNMLKRVKVAKSLQHNVIDGAALAYYALERWGT